MKSSASQMNYAASHDTVRISAKRFSQSPLVHKYANPDMVLGIYAGRFYPLTLGDDPIAQYWKLRNEVLLFDVPEKPLEIKGPDAGNLLEKVFSRRISDLKPGRGRYAIACLPNGGILMDGVLIRWTEDHFWYVQADGVFDTWLMAQGENMDVSIKDPEIWVFQIQGPRAFSVMQSATGGQLTEDMRYFHAATVNLGGQSFAVSRTGWTGELGYEIYTPTLTTDYDVLWQHLMDHGAPLGMEFSSLESMGIRRIEAGILDNGTDIDTTMTPFEAGMHRFVDFDKEDFIGRQALSVAPRDTLLMGLKCEQGIPYANLSVYAGDELVGKIKAGAWSPYLNCGIGYVKFNFADQWLDRPLTLISKTGEAFPAEACMLPFYDAEKRIPRTISA